MCEYENYIHLIASGRILNDVIEECIKEGLLSDPENELGAVGMRMAVEK